MAPRHHATLILFYFVSFAFFFLSFYLMSFFRCEEQIVGGQPTMLLFASKKPLHVIKYYSIMFVCIKKKADDSGMVEPN